MILWCYNGHLSAQTISTFRHIVFPVCRYAVQYVLQSVELVMVKHTDGVYRYPLCRYPAVFDVRFVHCSVTVRMDGTEVGIDRIRLFFCGVRCCSPVLNITDHFADRIRQERVMPCDGGSQIFCLHMNVI